jgi:hypothetical protein
MRLSDNEKEGKIPELSFANSQIDECLSRLALSSQILFYSVTKTPEVSI